MASETEWVAIKGTSDYLSRCGKFRAWYKRTAKDGYADYLVSYANSSPERLRYRRMTMEIRHVVWPTGAPPVCTWAWTQESWEAFESTFRPADYEGGAFDAAAWAEYEARKDAEFRREFYARHGVPDPTIK